LYNTHVKNKSDNAANQIKRLKQGVAQGISQNSVLATKAKLESTIQPKNKLTLDADAANTVTAPARQSVTSKMSGNPETNPLGEGATLPVRPETSKAKNHKVKDFYANIL